MKAQKITDKLSGTYLLEIFASEKFEISAKKFLGEIFPSGYYYYSGSAQKGYNSRLVRHLKEEKTLHWHIDYLTTIKTNRITTIFLFENAPRSQECEVVETLINKFHLDDYFSGFGNGDCKTCGTHLLYSKEKINHSQFSSLYHSIVSFNPSSKVISGL